MRRFICALILGVCSFTSAKADTIISAGNSLSRISDGKHFSFSAVVEFQPLPVYVVDFTSFVVNLQPDLDYGLAYRFNALSAVQYLLPNGVPGQQTLYFFQYGPNGGYSQYYFVGYGFDTGNPTIEYGWIQIREGRGYNKYYYSYIPPEDIMYIAD